MSMENTTPSPDPINAELERALFKRFWAWLAIVGTVIIAAVTAISVLVSQYLLLTAKSSSEEAAQRELAQLSDKIASIDKDSVDTAKKSAVNQTNSEASAFAAAAQAKEAQDLVKQINDLLKTNKAVLTGVETVQELANIIAAKPEFARTVIDTSRSELLSKIDTIRSELLSKLPTSSDFFIVSIPSTRQYAQAMCPVGSIPISATCTNDNGAQTAVGPKFRADGFISCERYATATNAEGAIMCMKLRN